MFSLKAWVAAVILLIAPSVQATDIAWHYKQDSPATWHNKNFERRGAVDFKTEAQGTYIASGANHDAQGQITPWFGQYVFRFSDLSTITARMEGTFDARTQTSKGSGQFVNGTGRFEGITGTATLAAKLTNGIMEGDLTGSYSLPGK